jgi:hypothetical protein
VERLGVLSILNPGKYPMLPFLYKPIILLDAVSKLFEKILLVRVLREINERGILHDQQFGFRPRLCTTFRWAAVNRKFDE